MSKKKNSDLGKVILILLTVFIIGPLVFVGTCFPIGLGLESITNSYGAVGIPIGIVSGLTISILAVIAISKRIARK